MRVIGLGQPAAGDDGVGHAVIEALRADPLPGVELVTVPDAFGLVELLDGTPTVLVDAAVGAGRPGEVTVVDAQALHGIRAVSSHAMSVPAAVALACTLNGDEAARALRVVAVAIDPPAGPGFGLSPALAAAVPAACEAVRAALREVRDA